MLKLARYTDLATVCAIDNASNQTPWSLGNYQECMANPQYKIYVYRDNENAPIIGFIVLSIVQYSAEILQIVVVHDYQNQGHGSIMLRQVCDALINIQVQEVFLEVRANNQAAILFYQKHGFKSIGVRSNYYTVNNQKIDALVMKCDI